MRLFVAVDPPVEAVTHLRGRLPSDDHLRWTDPSQWHITLTFCGDVAERAADQLRTRLGRAVGRHPPMTLRLAGVGAFARPARAHTLWVGVGGDVAGMSKLADSTTAAARRSGVEVETRRLRPHLTIARASPAADVRATVAALASYDGPTWVANEVHLVRSTLGARTVHERLASWRLGR